MIFSTCEWPQCLFRSVIHRWYIRRVILASFVLVGRFKPAPSGLPVHLITLPGQETIVLHHKTT
jgi:hypothetical protein